MGKRKRGKHGVSQVPKPPRSTEPLIKGSVLAKYYPSVLTLREYLISHLPASSKAPRKKIGWIGTGSKSRSRLAGKGTKVANDKENDTDSRDQDQELGRLLDQTLVGVPKDASAIDGERVQKLHTFSQRSSNYNSAQDLARGIENCCQNDIVDFCIWQLFQRENRPGPGSVSATQHLLCQGFRRHISHSMNASIPGVFSLHPNMHVSEVKGAVWKQVLKLLGRDGEKVMVDLLVDCAIFVALDEGDGNFHQLCGLPLGELTVLKDSAPATLLRPAGGQSALSGKVQTAVLRTPGSIAFVRNRMLYAKASLNAHGGVRFGLRHIHALNRYGAEPVSAGEAVEVIAPNTLQLMRYLFPRQFGLHNVFTSVVDSRETVQPFKDYTMREEEFQRVKKVSVGNWRDKCPKRLRGELVQLVGKMQILHKRCAYVELLNYYCPVPEKTAGGLQSNGRVFQGAPRAPGEENPDNSLTDATFRTQASLPQNDGQKPSVEEKIETSVDVNSSGKSSVIIPETKISFINHATPVAHVSVFCRSVLNKILPNGFFGADEVQKHNRDVLNRNIDRFIRLRRFETLTLHEVVQDMKVTDISWLAPPKLSGDKTSKTDISKRLEIFHELIYYIFDSLLIPLLRSNFHITESQAHRHRLFFFRHDTWRALVEPALSGLKTDMFEEMETARTQEILRSRPLGFSQIRLLPKATGVRPIMNLKRRMMKKGQKWLGASINSVLTPVHNMFNYERLNNPSKLGSTLFSVGDIYHRLRSFKDQLGTSQPLYFAKVDVTAAFDTIPQSAMTKLMSNLPTSTSYRLARHVEIKAQTDSRNTYSTPGNPIRKYVTLAAPKATAPPFEEVLPDLISNGKNRTIFVHRVAPSHRETYDLLALLNSHIHHNIVKIGKKYYRQARGIPQGSVLSSLLCNYFYADLEAKHLSFLSNRADTMLLRLVDDFLLITVDRHIARRFLQIMHDGVPDYGVSISPTKTLTNFEASVNGVKIARLVDSTRFPYCGTMIDVRNLEISRDEERLKDEDVQDTLTVEFARRPGATFHRKVLNSFKIQAHAMFLDTEMNGVKTVSANLHAAFTETARKMVEYWRCLPGKKRPAERVVRRTVEDLAELAFVLCRSKGRRDGSFRCSVPKRNVLAIARKAVREVCVGRTGWGWVESL